MKNEEYFNNIDTKEKAYWLGFIYADGSVSQENSKDKRLEIGLSSKDEKHLQKFADIFDKTVSRKIVKLSNNKEYSQSRIFIQNNLIYKRLINLGVCPRKTYSDDLSIFDNISKGLINHFIRGFFDGDGTVYFDKNYGNCTIGFIGRLSLMSKLKEILKTIGISEKSLNIYNVKKSETYELRCGARKEIVKFKEFIYLENTISLERKFDRLMKVIPKRSSIEEALINVRFKL